MKEETTSDSILVAYATRYGSTQEVAEQVAATLREKGLEVDLRPARQAQSVDDYRAVVLGTPFYIGRWLKDARRFLTQHQEDLQERPVAVFSLGPMGEGEDEWKGVREQLDKELAGFPWPLIAFFGWVSGQFVIGYFFNDFLMNSGFLIPLMILGLMALAIASASARDIVAAS